MFVVPPVYVNVAQIAGDGVLEHRACRMIPDPEELERFVLDMRAYGRAVHKDVEYSFDEFFPIS